MFWTNGGDLLEERSNAGTGCTEKQTQGGAKGTRELVDGTYVSLWYLVGTSTSPQTGFPLILQLGLLSHRALFRCLICSFSIWRTHCPFACLAIIKISVTAAISPASLWDKTTAYAPMKRFALHTSHCEVIIIMIIPSSVSMAGNLTVWMCEETVGSLCIGVDAGSEEPLPSCVPDRGRSSLPLKGMVCLYPCWKGWYLCTPLYRMSYSVYFFVLLNGK